MTIADREWFADLIVFVSYFLTAKLAQYILFGLNTSPALIWAPTGIALAAVILKGNKMWVPIALAYFIGIVTLPGYQPLTNELIATLGFTLQPLLGAALFRKMDSDGTIHRSRDVMIFLAGAMLTAAIGPLFNTIGQVLLHTLSETMWLTFTRAWAGGVLSILVVTPFITGWYNSPSWPLRCGQNIEAIIAFGLLLASTYLLFWDSFPDYVFALIFFLCIALFWISFRFGSRVLTTAVLSLTVFGIMGSIIGHPTATPLKVQLFADELFIILLAPIFFQFFVLMEERRVAERTLALKVQELEAMAVKLSSNDAAKNEFIAILAHELRNPLASVVSILELMKLENPSPETLDMIERAEHQSWGMNRLLDDLLDVKRIAERKFTLLCEETDLESIVRRSVGAVMPALASKGHTLTMSLPPERVELFVDPVRIEQVLSNLLHNAIKYTQDGGKLSIACTVCRDAVALSLSDTGEGIPEELLERIFQPFQQLNPAPHRSSGIGVGLFLAREIIEKHGGNIRVESAGPGRGSTFTIELPVHKREPVARTQSMSAATSAAEEPVSPRTILIVDDNEAAAESMRKLLMHDGHTVQNASTGSDALVRLRDGMPDVVILDIGLPDMSGYEVARAVRSRESGKRPVLVALTGYGQASDRQSSLDAGFDYHLTKPVRMVDLKDIIDRPVHDFFR